VLHGSTGSNQGMLSRNFGGELLGPGSFGAPTAHCNAAFLKQAGVPVDFTRLADIGIRGNGHFLMLEKNNLEIAAVIADWLERRVTPSEAQTGRK
jgi:hypothetical protein